MLSKLKKEICKTINATLHTHFFSILENNSYVNKRLFVLMCNESSEFFSECKGVLRPRV